MNRRTRSRRAAAFAAGMTAAFFPIARAGQETLLLLTGQPVLENNTVPFTDTFFEPIINEAGQVVLYAYAVSPVNGDLSGFYRLDGGGPFQFSRYLQPL